jgi:sulfur carrier protein
MPEGLTLHINGQPRSLPTLPASSTLSEVIAALELRPDRLAVELNGDIAPRASWTTLPVNTGDKLEIVHFVGGGTCS